jgi:hypothetical protein
MSRAAWDVQASLETDTEDNCLRAALSGRQCPLGMPQAMG